MRPRADCQATRRRMRVRVLRAEGRHDVPQRTKLDIDVRPLAKLRGQVGIQGATGQLEVEQGSVFVRMRLRGKQPRPATRGLGGDSSLLQDQRPHAGLGEGKGDRAPDDSPAHDDHVGSGDRTPPATRPAVRPSHSATSEYSGKACWVKPADGGTATRIQGNRMMPVTTAVDIVIQVSAGRGGDLSSTMVRRRLCRPRRLVRGRVPASSVDVIAPGASRSGARIPPPGRLPGSRSHAPPPYPSCR